MSTTGNVVYAVMVASGLTASAVTQIAPMMPRPATHDFFEVNSITAKRVGDTAVLVVDRVIKVPLIMGYAVRVFSIVGHDATLFCAAQGGPFRYRPDAVLPDPITLDWWTDGKCHAIPPGRVQIETTWDPVVPDMEPLSVTVEVEE